MKTHLTTLLLCGLLGTLLALPCYGVADGRNPGFVVGYGMSFVGSDDYRTNDIYGDGIFFKGEYGFLVSRNIEPRLYLGGIFTSAKQPRGGEVLSPSDVSASMGFAGAKIHIVLPIPKIAPFFEVGVGGSVGSLSTRIGDLYDEDHSGPTIHIPFSLGLAFGDRRMVEVTFSYLFYPAFNHINGGVAVGIHFGKPPKPSSTNSAGDFGVY